MTWCFNFYQNTKIFSNYVNSQHKNNVQMNMFFCAQRCYIISCCQSTTTFSFHNLICKTTLLRICAWVKKALLLLHVVVVLKLLWSTNSAETPSFSSCKLWFRRKTANRRMERRTFGWEEREWIDEERVIKEKMEWAIYKRANNLINTGRYFV